MSLKQYLALFCLFLIYINLGAFMFFSIERPVEEDRRKVEKSAALEIKGGLLFMLLVTRLIKSF